MNGLEHERGVVAARIREGMRQRRAEMAAAEDRLESPHRSLDQLVELDEPSAVSARPVIGPLITFARRAAKHLFLRWYLRGMLDQQERFNRAVSEHLAELEDIAARQGREINALRARLNEGEREDG